MYFFLFYNKTDSFNLKIFINFKNLIEIVLRNVIYDNDRILMFLWSDDSELPNIIHIYMKDFKKLITNVDL